MHGLVCRYSASKPLLVVNFSIRLLSVTVRTTVLEAPSGSALRFPVLRELTFLRARRDG